MWVFKDRALPLSWLFLSLLMLMAFMNQYAALHGWNHAFMHCMLKSLIACGIFGLTFLFNEYFLERTIPVGYLIAVCLLLWVECCGLTVKGATRWVKIGHLTMQPSEIAKIFTPLMAAQTVFFFKKSSSFTLLVAVFIVNIIPGLLILKQPDLGSALLMFSAGLLPLLLSPISLRFFLSLGAMVCASLPLAWTKLHTYQQVRILTLFNPERDPLGQGYHVQQSKIAIGSGGLMGKGFTNNTQADYDFLPEHDTDFAFALFAEEWGLVGCVLVISLFFCLKIQLFLLILKTRNYYTQLIMFSLVAPIFLYVFINIGMVSGILPVVGVPLPFFSRGGTHLLITMLSLGLFYSLYLHDKKNYRSYY